MRSKLHPLAWTVAAMLLALALPAFSAPPPIAWQSWSDEVFARARREHKFVILDLEAVWCHWCHVQNETTYHDPKVVSLINSHYIAVRVDQDSRPDLSNRYEDYGWPATIVFNADGQELVKFAGYIPPPRMAGLLQGVVDDPRPGPSVIADTKVTLPSQAALSDAERATLQKLLRIRYDDKLGGWGDAQKFLSWDNVEYCMEASRHHDADAERMARQTLELQFKLIDPVWGGVDQYSDGGDWDHPHFEKIMQFQANNIRIYSLAYAQYHDERYLKAAQQIRGYLKGFLTSPDGAFYVSQDADLVAGKHSGEYYQLDDAARRKLGVPRVDQHIYARENGWAIQGLVALYSVTGDDSVLQDARRAATWIDAHRALPGGGYRHDSQDVAGPYLADTLAMGQAWLALYTATGDRADLAKAIGTANFIQKNFVEPGTAGLVTAVSKSRFNRQRAQTDENIAAVRFLNMLARYGGNPQWRKLAEQAMRYLAAPEIAEVYSAAGILLADGELRTDPTHLTIVGRKDDPGAHTLLVTALSLPSAYKRIEWLDRREGPLPNPDVDYPDMDRAAAYVCAQNRCSRPAFSSDELRAVADRLLK